MINYLVNLASSFMPATRAFKLKRMLYRLVGFSFGDNVAIGNCIKCYVLGHVHIGSDSWLGRNLDFTVPRGVELFIGSSVDVAPHVKFHCGSHRIGPGSRRAGPPHSQSISIGDGCWIGSSSLILGGVNLGSGSVVAAGAVVIAGDYPPDVLLAGVPAKVVKEYDDQ